MRFKRLSLRGYGFIFVASLGLTVLLYSFGMPVKAAADCPTPYYKYAQNTAAMPRPCNFTGSSAGRNMRLDVADTGSGGNSLQSTSSRVKIYSTDRTPQLTITGYNHCTNTDTIHFLQTTYTVYQETAAGNQGSQITSFGNEKKSGSCDDTGDTTLNLSHPDGAQTIGDLTFYVWDFQATIDTDKIGAVNSFSLQISSGYIGFSNDSGDHFALQNRESGTHPSDFYLPMGTSCDITSATKEYLRWFDDDYGNEGVQPQNILFGLYDLTSGGYIPLADIPGHNYIVAAGGNEYYPRAGSGNAGQASFTAQPYHKYVWIWHNVSDNNGIQFQMPFDSIYKEVNCVPPANWRLVGATRANVASVAAGGSVTFSSSIKNTGTTTAYPFSYGPRYFFSATNQTGTTNPAIAGETTSPTASGGSIGAGVTYAGANITQPVAVPVSQTGFICGTVAFSPYNSDGAVNGRSPAVCVPITTPVLVTPTCAVLSFLSDNGQDSLAEPNEGFTIKATYDYVTPAAASTAAGHTFTFTAGSLPASHVLTSLQTTGTKVTVTHDFTTGIAATGDYIYNVSDDTAHITVPGGCPMEVSNKPIVQAFSGDVIAGIGTPTVTGCLGPNSHAAVVGWNGDTAGNGYAGAGAQFGVRAMDVIRGFASAQGNHADGLNGTGLSFANTTVSPAGDNFGGQSGDMAACDSTTYQYGTQTINGTGLSTVVAMQVPDGKNVAYYRGDVYITGDITYAPGGWTTTNDIPSYSIVALGGNIYVDSSVKQIDANLVAEPDTAGGGTGGGIYTCASVSGNASFHIDTVTPTTDADFYNDCGQAQLAVNGSLIAKSIYFYRTCGTLHQATAADKAVSTGGTDTNSCNTGFQASHAAEVINYGPASWLGQSSGSKVKWDAITSLPPVL